VGQINETENGNDITKKFDIEFTKERDDSMVVS